MVPFARTVAILSRQSRSMVANLSFSFAATLALLHPGWPCVDQSMDGDDWREIVLAHRALFVNKSSTDTVPSIGVLISSANQTVTSTTMLSPEHITQHCPEHLPPHLELRELKTMDRFGFCDQRSMTRPELE
ncbi:hypothetical protein BLNAU_20755 [Blattamonas nauphoetae]|uniref:Secreted protein n=1 Tax=Blattamonas nauphoetae TaxID=2049346 RepID=A0ABQ9WXW4_9EUKA|nr:hypothetical protein BLNAU_20755 [Blattamonas nauphoetae]